MKIAGESAGDCSVLQVAVIVAFAALAVCFWVLQIAQHQKYEEMAENNHQRTLALRAPRGILFDRNGKVLVENRHSFTISILREHSKDLDQTARLLARVAGLDLKQVQDIIERHRGEPSYRPIVVVEDATLAQVAAITARRLDFELPDVRVEEVPTRKYPESLAAHLFGYVGQVSDAQVASDPVVKSGDIVGQSGIEKIYNGDLKGADGARVVVVNSLGREMSVLQEEKPTEGKRLQLTIDYDVQRATEEAFNAVSMAGLTNAGAAVILDPRTGEVLAFMSRPTYDPNAFAAGIDRGTWASLNSDEQRPLNNRAIQGRYSPGSTFKMAVGLAGLEEDVIDPNFHVHCGGGANFYGRYFKCWKKGGHGSVDLKTAIAQSCDVYFYTVANMLGVDRINKWATLLGLGVKSGIDLPNEVTGLVPSTKWKQETRREKWYAGETISVGIGQGAVSVTPVSMAVYMATIANGGTRVTPHLVKAIDDGSDAAGSRWRRHPHSRSSTSRPRSCRRFATGCGWWSTAAVLVDERASLEKTSPARPGRLKSSRTRAALRRVGSAICATTAGSRSSRRATIRRSPASYSSNTECTGQTLRRSRITSSTRTSRSRMAVRCRPRRSRR